MFCCFNWFNKPMSSLEYGCPVCGYKTPKFVNLEYHIKYYHEMDEETYLLKTRVIYNKNWFFLYYFYKLYIASFGRHLPILEADMLEGLRQRVPSSIKMSSNWHYSLLATVSLRSSGCVALRAAFVFAWFSQNCAVGQSSSAWPLGFAVWLSARYMCDALMLHNSLWRFT